MEGLGTFASYVGFPGPWVKQVVFVCILALIGKLAFSGKDKKSSLFWNILLIIAFITALNLFGNFYK
ncbi:hypothetical protein OXPF_26790 [Oxobacter pfennigii]|uniref:Uncharacterized protein n=1 Tax=Oxobacter pfennigii TaxID=36849 RepID=A0A0P8YA51_9CLOT|nr:hypothetical protein OXPF_26790 [Oxobacter pfennigii]